MAPGQLEAPGSELAGQAGLLSRQPAQRAGEKCGAARPALAQLVPAQSSNRSKNQPTFNIFGTRLQYFTE